jgi:hypothetical protein
VKLSPSLGKQIPNLSFRPLVKISMMTTTVVVSRSPVKHCGMALQDPTASAKPNYEASSECSSSGCPQGQTKYFVPQIIRPSAVSGPNSKPRKKAKDDSS